MICKEGSLLEYYSPLDVAPFFTSLSTNNERFPVFLSRRDGFAAEQRQAEAGAAPEANRGGEAEDGDGDGQATRKGWPASVPQSGDQRGKRTNTTNTNHNFSHKESKGDQHNLLENQIHQKRMAKLLESLHKVVKALQFIP